MANISRDQAQSANRCGEACLSALADPTRRRIFAILRDGPCPVGDIARRLPVSRPAVSQHLRMLSDAGLVAVTPRGTRRMYAVSPEGLFALRGYLDSLWSDVLQGFSDFVSQMETDAMLPPIEKILHVPIDPARAFELFTGRLDKWWPVESHSLSAGQDKRPKSVLVEPKAGGQILEHCADGKTRPWARITAWQPGERFAVKWHVGRDEGEATDLTIVFARVEGGTCVTLTHSGWESLGEAARTIRSGYLTGWDKVLGDRFGAACLREAALVSA